MIRTKTKTSRAREMREDLSILMGIQRGRKIQKFSAKSDGQPGFANHRVSAVVTRNQQDLFLPGFFGKENENKSSMFLPPPLVTPAACRAARIGELKPKNSRWPVCSSQPITRVENTNPDGFRQPVPFMLNCVQQPPSGILVSSENQNDNAPAPAAAPNSNCLLQSPWVSRSDLNKTSSCRAGTQLSEVTSKYSVKELIDSLCGDGPEIPEIFERFPHKVANNKSKSDESPFSGEVEHQSVFMESVSISSTLFDAPKSESGTLFEPMQIPTTLFEPPATPNVLKLKPSIKYPNWGNEMNSTPTRSQDKPKTVTFMEPAKLPERWFGPPAPMPSFSCGQDLQKISTPPPPWTCSTSTESSSSPEATTSTCVSPFFTDGLAFLQTTYGGGGSDAEDSPRNQQLVQVQHLF